MRTINVEGSTLTKFNIFQFDNTTPIPIAAYNQHIVDVRTENKTRSLYSFYKPRNIPLLNPFKEFERGKCYIVAAKSSFNIVTNAPTEFPAPPNKLEFVGAAPARFTIFRYPYQTPTSLSSLPAVIRAETLNPTKTMFRVYSSASRINPFNTLEFNNYYVILADAPFEIKNPDVSPAPVETPRPTPIMITPLPTSTPTATSAPTPVPTSTPTPTPQPMNFQHTLTGPDGENPYERISIVGNSDSIYFNTNQQEPSLFVNMIVIVNGQQRSSVSFAIERVGSPFGYRLNNSGAPQVFGIFQDGEVRLTA